MQKHRMVGAVLAGAALIVCAACSQDLNVTNPNTPDVARAVASPSDVQHLATSSIHSWYQTAVAVDPWIMLNVTGDLMTMNFGNFGARFNNLEPRIAYNNSTASGDEEAVQNPWNGQYGTVGQANDVLRAIANGVVLPGGTDKYKALAMFSQAGALMELALVYNQAFPVDETTQVATLAPYTDMEKFAKGKIDALIALTATQSETYTSSDIPASFDPGGTSYSSGRAVNAAATSALLNRVANTWGAQLLAYSPRSAAEAATVDWNSVLAYAKKGLGSGGGAPMNFSVSGDYNNWWSDLTSYFDLPSWMMIDLKLVHKMAPNVPNSYTGLPASPRSAYDGVWAPQGTFDARLSVDTSDVNTYISGVDDATDYTYAAQVQGSAARGIYMQSPYYHTRYIDYSYQSNNPQIGPTPYILASENDLLEAEALVRTHGDKALAASLVNNTRVNRGHLTPLTAATDDATFLAAILYEIEVECNATDGYGFFALRGADEVQAGTVRHLPVPAGELQTDGLAVYTFGGVGLPDRNVLPSSGTGPTMSGDLTRFEVGPWRTLATPSGKMMLLPSPSAPMTHHALAAFGRY